MPAAPPARHLVFLIRDLGRGGAQRQLTVLASSLAKRAGWEVTVVHFYPGEFEAELRASGVRCVCVNKRRRWDMAGFFLRLRRVLRELRPDVLHGYLHEANLAALMMKPFCGWPLVVWGIRDSRTDADTWGWLGRLSFRLNCLCSGLADLIVANSQAGRDYYLGHGYPADRFFVVPNGIKAPTDAAPPAENQGFRFGLIGRLHPAKDHATFLRAAAEARRSHPQARFVCVGGGTDTYAERMRALSAELGLEDCLEWLPATGDMAAVYGGLGAVVSASEHEGFSNVLAEAMAHGLPCIASAVGDSAFLLGDGEWTFTARDAPALAAKMRVLMDLDSESRAALGARLRERVRAEFSVERLVERTETLLGGAPVAEKSRILWITTGLGTGGAEMMLTQLVTRLDDHSHTVLSLTAGGKHVETLRAAGIEVHSLDMPAGRPTAGALLQLAALVRARRPALIMGWMYHGCLAALMARSLGGRRVPVVWNIRQSLYDLALEKRGSALVIRLLAKLSALADVITYNSETSARQHEALGYEEAKTRLIPNGFDLEKWRPLPRPRAAGSKLRVGRFGRYTAMKDYPAFVEAAALVARQMPDVEFLLAGPGVDAGNAELVECVTRHFGAAAGAVRLLGERHDLPELTASLDLAVSSSAFGEGFPNVIGEAMACGVPVVATDIGDTRWVMGGAAAVGALAKARETGHAHETDPRILANAPTETGVLSSLDTRGNASQCNPNSEPQTSNFEFRISPFLAASMLRILSLPEAERRALGLAGRARIEAHFSLDSVLRQYEELFSTLTFHD
ncbi:MAG TPA: glycosyltransferase [Prosthecobacter sp.]|nr:glycosyltransferase [Prosthecobacter sp.]HRK15537.1 glycosyltransferase [Prosthecobacter sp.]